MEELEGGTANFRKVRHLLKGGLDYRMTRKKEILLSCRGRAPEISRCISNEKRKNKQRYAIIKSLGNCHSQKRYYTLTATLHVGRYA